MVWREKGETLLERDRRLTRGFKRCLRCWIWTAEKKFHRVYDLSKVLAKIDGLRYVWHQYFLYLLWLLQWWDLRSLWGLANRRETQGISSSFVGARGGPRFSFCVNGRRIEYKHKIWNRRNNLFTSPTQGQIPAFLPPASQLQKRMRAALDENFCSLYSSTNNIFQIKLTWCRSHRQNQCNFGVKDWVCSIYLCRQQLHGEVTRLSPQSGLEIGRSEWSQPFGHATHRFVQQGKTHRSVQSLMPNPSVLNMLVDASLQKRKGDVWCICSIYEKVWLGVTQ